MKNLRILSYSMVNFINYKKNLNLIFLGIYVVSILFSSIQVLPGYSLSFFTATALFTYKLIKLLVTRKMLYLSGELFLAVVLYLYIIAAEIFLHNSSINNYLITFGLNCIILLLLSDEFYRNLNVREYVMRLYVATAVLVGLLIKLEVMTTISSSGRKTFMMQNENELAAALLIAYVYLSLKLINIKFIRISISSVVYYLSLYVLINAIIVTGTRFAMVGIIVVAFLTSLFAIIDRERLRSGLIYAAFNTLLTILIIFTNNFQLVEPLSSFNFNSQSVEPLSGDKIKSQSVEKHPDYIFKNRWNFDNPSNNLKELGGRLHLWKNSTDAFIQSPIIGLGHNNFVKYVVYRDNFYMNPHNFFMEIAGISGIIGIILIIGVVFIFIRKILIIGDIKLIQNSLIWGVPLIFIMMMIGVTHFKIFWFLLAYYISAININIIK